MEVSAVRVQTVSPDINREEDIEKIQKLLTNNWVKTSIEWKVFHVILISSCILSPILLITTFVSIAYTNEQSMSCCSISKVIANPKTADIVIITTTISAFLAFFISVCRQIQIRIKFTEYNHSTLRNWIYANRIAVCFNCCGYFFMIMMACFDSLRYPTIHTTFSSLAFVFCQTFAIFTAFVTIKQRRIEYGKNLERYKGDKSKAFKNTFFVDSILLFVLSVLSTIFLIIYVVGFFGGMAAAIGRGEDANKASELLPPFVNISEWLSFMCLISTLMVLALGFQYDNVDDELIQYFKRCQR